MSDCKILNCKNKVLAKNLCNAHYIRQRKNKDMDKPIQILNPSQICIECGKSTKGKGGYQRCQTHYNSYKRKLIKERLIQQLGGKCTMCNGIFPQAAFDFHHLGDKEMDVSSMINTQSEKKIQKEIKKCILLCANCHRIHHAE